jgi:hypothetical protein
MSLQPEWRYGCLPVVVFHPEDVPQGQVRELGSHNSALRMQHPALRPKSSIKRQRSPEIKGTSKNLSLPDAAPGNATITG